MPNKFKILKKSVETVWGCCPMGEIHEMQFLDLTTNETLYACIDDVEGDYYVISSNSVIEDIKSESEESHLNIIEEYQDFEECKTSKYYEVLKKLNNWRMK